MKIAVSARCAGKMRHHVRLTPVVFRVILLIGILTMRKIFYRFRDWSVARRLEKSRANFDAACSEVLEAHRKAGRTGVTPELHEATAEMIVAQRRLKEAELDFDLVTVGPEPVELTPLVIKKVRQSFPPEQQLEVIRSLENECARNLLFSENGNSQVLERVRLAVVKAAGGILEELHRQIGIAKRDWRDVINSAEYPEAVKLGYINYGQLNREGRSELEARDRQQYEAWLFDEGSLR
jgi:hypothetical protein